jgi:hypothetical protein
MKDLVSVRPSPVRHRLAGWRLGLAVASVALPFAVALPASAHTPEEVASQVVGCHAGGGDLSGCIDAAKLAILVEEGVAVLPAPSSGNPPIPPVPPVPGI